MSRNDFNNPYPDWGRLHPNMLWCVLKKLDTASLFNCMFVNQHWRNEVEDRCNKRNLWHRVVDGATNWKTSVFRDKSKLDDRGISQSAYFWCNVKNATVSFNHRYEIKGIRDISIFKDNLIVTSDKGAEYYNIDTFQLVRTPESNYFLSGVDHYIETSTFIITITSPKLNLLGHNTFTAINKLHAGKCDCIKPLKRIFKNVIYWRVDNDSCYIWNKEHILMRYIAEQCNWNEEALAFYECSSDFVFGLNIYRENTFLFTKNDPGNFRGSSREIFRLSITLPDSIKPRMFNTFSVLCAVAPENQQYIYPESLVEQILVAFPGVSSATEHGHMLILGYKDGKIQIYRRADLTRRIMNPKLQFNLQDYSGSLSNKIIAIDVFEATSYHQLFVATGSNIYEFHISYE